MSLDVIPRMDIGDPIMSGEWRHWDEWLWWVWTFASGWEEWVPSYPYLLSAVTHQFMAEYQEAALLPEAAVRVQSHVLELMRSTWQQVMGTTCDDVTWVIQDQMDYWNEAMEQSHWYYSTIPAYNNMAPGGILVANSVQVSCSQGNLLCSHFDVVFG